MSSFPGICACEYGEHIVGVVNLSFYEDSESTFISKFVYYLRESNFKAGFSTSFRKLENIRMAWKQSIIALNLGLQNNPDIWNHKFEDYALEYMISQMYSDFDFKFLCSKGILKLREYDKHNQTEYYKTLKTYLENKENVVKTAETLFIHRGTMIYRLKRIKELTGMALESIDELLYLHLSIRMIEMNKDEL
jgi:DNA-binding PucR family transcriptional regulator